MFSLKDKVALVTGASQGIGRDTALALAQAGAKVAVAARNEEKLATLVREIEGAGGAALAVSAGGSVVIAALVGIIGALAGTFGGYNVRHALVSRAHLPDLAVALVEDGIAVAGGLLIVSHL